MNVSLCFDPIPSKIPVTNKNEIESERQYVHVQVMLYGHLLGV